MLLVPYEYKWDPAAVLDEILDETLVVFYTNTKRVPQRAMGLEYRRLTHSLLNTWRED